MTHQPTRLKTVEWGWLMCHGLYHIRMPTQVADYVFFFIHKSLGPFWCIFTGVLYTKISDPTEGENRFVIGLIH